MLDRVQSWSHFTVRPPIEFVVIESFDLLHSRIPPTTITLNLMSGL